MNRSPPREPSMPEDYVTVPEPEIRSRLKRLRARLPEEALDGVILLGNANLLYYAGTVQDAVLVVPAEGEPCLLVRKHLEKARSDSPIPRIEPMRSFREIPDRAKAWNLPAAPRLGMEFDRVPVSVYRRWRELLPAAAWKNASGFLADLRTVKSDYEIAAIREAGGMVVSAVRSAPEHYRTGMTELELSTLLARKMRLAGHPGHIRTRSWRSEVFMGGAVSSGTSPSTPWPFDGPVAVYSPFASSNTLSGRRVIGEDTPVVVDMLGIYDGYIYDFTRTFRRGRLDPRLAEAHELAVAIRDRLTAAMKPGNLPEDLYAEAFAMAEDAGLGAHFMNHGLNQVRFVGHGLGLELDETPVIARRFTEPLRAGQVIALEPKFVFPDLGGVGVEDTILVTDEGGEILCPAPTEIVPLD